MAKTPRKATRRKKPATVKPAAKDIALARRVRYAEANITTLIHQLEWHDKRFDGTPDRAELAALTARVRALERGLAALEATDPDPNDFPRPCGPLDIIATAQLSWNPGELPDPLAGCVVAKNEPLYPLWPIHNHDAFLTANDDGWWMERPGWKSSDTPTHPAPCRETGTLRPIIVGSWWHRRRSTDLTTRPLPGDASCLLEEDGVSIKNGVYNWIMPYLNTWMIGDIDENGNDRYPDFTIPRSTSFTIPRSTTWMP